MAQPIEKWLPSVLYFPVMMLIGLFVMWQCQTNMVVLVAITGGIIFVYHAVALVRGRNSIFWPGISWSLGYFLIGAYYFYGRGATRRHHKHDGRPAGSALRLRDERTTTDRASTSKMLGFR